MKLSTNGLQLIKHFEGCKLKAYRCSAGVWTIGYGHTGSDVKEGMIISQNKADELLFNDVVNFERDVNSLVKIPLKQCQFDALVSFSYNCGSDIDKDTIAEGLGDSTLLKYINSKKFDLAVIEFGKWISKGKPAEKGLIKRREAESKLFKGEEWS